MIAYNKYVLAAQLNRVCEARHHRLSSEKHTVAVSVYALLVFLALSLLFGVVFMQTGNHRLQREEQHSLLVALRGMTPTGLTTRLH